MAISSSKPTGATFKLLLCFLLYSVSMFSLCIASAGGTFQQEFDISWGDGRGKMPNNGNLLTLSLDKTSGSGFQSKNEYLYGKIDMQLKLVPGNSAGTVTAYYLSSQGPTHDEIDFEFLGNLSGDPYTLHTNVFTQGKGNREQQFKLWFDPTKNFHTYSLPNNQPMRIYSSIWNAEDWATRGGIVKIDWTKAPFTASYQNFNADACVQSLGVSKCTSSPKNSSSSNTGWLTQQLDCTNQERMKWVQKNFMIYNYCTDLKRFSTQGLPPECTV